jgi:hypothetical protein
VIAPDVEDKEIVSVQLRNITITLEQDAMLQDLIWELSILFPTGCHPFCERTCNREPPLTIGDLALAAPT